MKRNVFTDGNGSKLVMIEGMGIYAPSSELDRLTSENARLRVALKECINELKAFQSDHEDFGSEEFIAEQEDLLTELEKDQ